MLTKFWIVFFQTYKKHIKSKSFVVSSLVTMLIIGVLTNASQVAQNAQITRTKDIGFVIEEKDNFIENSILNKIKKENRKWNPVFYVDESKAKEEIVQGKIEGYTVITESKNGIHATFKAAELANQVLTLELESFLAEVQNDQLLQSYGLSMEEINALNQPFTLGKVALNETAKTSETIQQSSIVIFILLIIIYASVVFYGSTIAIEVASEKSSRIMEVLVSSTPPIWQMFGKIFAVAGVGITQYALFFVFGRASYVAGGASSFLQFNEVPTSTFVYAIIFFLLGYFLYSSLLAMVGSLANRIEEVYQLISPINFFMIAGFIFSLIAMADPASNFVKVMSFVPFFTPMLFFLRVSILQVPSYEIAIAITIMLITIFIFAYLGAKVYKGGVLIYGKTTFKNIAKALQITSKKK